MLVVLNLVKMGVPALFKEIRTLAIVYNPIMGKTVKHSEDVTANTLREAVILILTHSTQCSLIIRRSSSGTMDGIISLMI